MTPIGWFGKTVAGAGLAIVLGFSGCTSVLPKHGPETISRSSPTAASSATATSHGTKIDVTWAHLYRSDFGAAAEYVCSAGQQCRWRLETTRDQGRHWRDITPAGAERGPNGFAPFFLNPSRIWVATVDCAGGKGRVYRSVDAGRTWQGTPGPGVSCAQGSVTPEFLDATDGYLVALQPTAPDAYLMRTSDGGMTWKPVRTHSVMGGVPVVAPVSFTSVKDGWAGGGWFAWGNLYVTKDGGVHWRRAFGGQAQPTFLPDVPTPVGDELVLPITLQEQGHLGVRFDRSIDGGSTWTPASVPTFVCRERSFMRPSRLWLDRSRRRSSARPCGGWRRAPRSTEPMTRERTGSAFA